MRCASRVQEGEDVLERGWADLIVQGDDRLQDAAPRGEHVLTVLQLGNSEETDRKCVSLKSRGSGGRTTKEQSCG